MIEKYIGDQLSAYNLSLDEFKNVTRRLLANQVLYAEQSKVERELYNLFARIEHLVIEYLGVLGFTVFHDKQQNYVVVFAPGTSSPHYENDDDEDIKGLQRKLSSDAIHLLLVLLQLYEQSLIHGEVDEDGCAKVSIENLNHSFRSVLAKEALSGTQRTEAFKACSKLRVLEGTSAEWDNPEGWIKIRPVITSLVFSNMVNIISDALPDEHYEEAKSEEEERVQLIASGNSLFEDENN